MINRLFYQDNRIDDDIRVFNIVHLVCFVGMILISLLVPAFVEDVRGTYLSFAACIMFLITMHEGNRTGRRKICVVVMSLFFNIIYLPLMFFMFGRMICVIPVYFLFGIIYSILLLDAKLGTIIGIIEFCYYLLLLAYGYKTLATPMEDLTHDEVVLRYGSTMVATVVTGMCAGAAVRFRQLYYEYVNSKCEEIKKEAMDSYVTKDMFLVNMSHEIRTPMNAIVGAVNLLLDRDINEQVSDSMYNILNSCNALLSITDELMDLSKSERGDIELYCSTYDFNEFIMEIINIVTVRLTESGIDFFVDVNKDIPRYLRGDSSKLRQVFVNVLNNAIKFTKDGRIILRIDYEELPDSNIKVIVDVEDTGIGIKQENIVNVFAKKRIDNEENIASGAEEKPGMGLSICADIVDKMQGDIAVDSKYGVGSVFTFKYVQEVCSNEVVARIKNDNNYNVLVYEKNDECSENVRRTLQAISISCDIAVSHQDFERLLSSGIYTHIFISNEKYEEVDDLLNSRLNPEKIVVLLDVGENVSIRNASAVINRPLNAINMCDFFNDEKNNYVRDISRRGDFICPHVVFLVVDDNYTNLNVASSILKKYGASVLTAVSGADCLRVLKENEVDMVLLDYMMPEMNGIDTLENIRKIPGSKYTSLPVIALTANVVSGAREMFLEAGFDDFLAKPIVIDKLEKVIKKYLPKELIVHKD